MKVKLGGKNCLYPMPTTLVGANINGKPNYITIAHVGIMNQVYISLSIAKKRYTNAGIKENQTFSINIPSVGMVEKTDYCGLVSGKDIDKAKLFQTFYGKLQTAPIIKECPINMECRLVQTIEFQERNLFIGEIVETYCDEECQTDRVVDFSKVQPILFVMNDRSYWKLGEQFAKAWNIGRKVKSPD